MCVKCVDAQNLLALPVPVFALFILCGVHDLGVCATCSSFGFLGRDCLGSGECDAPLPGFFLGNFLLDFDHLVLFLFSNLKSN